jgi:ribokinase
MSDQWRIAVLGSTMIDLIAYSHRVPAPGETIEADTFRLGVVRCLQPTRTPVRR